MAHLRDEEDSEEEKEGGPKMGTERMVIIDEEDDDDGEYVYDLVSYLVHKGASAIGGHFVAHVYDEK